VKEVVWVEPDRHNKSLITKKERKNVWPYKGKMENATYYRSEEISMMAIDKQYLNI